MSRVLIHSPKINKLYEIAWIDHESESEWQSPEELIEWIRKDVICTTIGFVRQISHKYLIICAESNNNDVSLCTKIYRPCIISVKPL